jgi:hydroxymethylpyrimidine pyrophosphatase-like HAD family hydrolase
MFEYIKLRRTMCYGTCPVYSVVVDKEGNVSYNGEMFVYKSGEYNWKISKKKIKRLNDLLKEFDFKSFVYEPGDKFITDQASCITTVKFTDSEIKEINHYLGDLLLDDSLTVFEKNIEKIIGIKKYVNPKLYIYEVARKSSKNIEKPCDRYLVISASEEEAIVLIKKECSNGELLELEAQKIGVAINDYYGPVIFMKGSGNIH